jgi:hypothetical protein
MFEKHVPHSHIKILVTKSEKRAREEGKGTALLNIENPIILGSVGFFKKRKFKKEAETALPSTGI